MLSFLVLHADLHPSILKHAVDRIGNVRELLRTGGGPGHAVASICERAFVGK